MPERSQNLVGKQFGHLTVLKKSQERGTQGEYKWLCRCDCGNLTTVTTAMLNSGETTSCGHVRLDKAKENLKFTESRHLKQLNNRRPKNNKTGYKNILRCKCKGKECYRVAIVYNHKQHNAFRDTLDEALIAREELRKKWWPNYKQ